MGQRSLHWLARALASGLLALGLTSAAAVHAEPALHLVTESGPYTFLVDGQVGGPATELMRQLLAQAGITGYDITLYPWARAYATALRSPDVLIFMIARTPQREALFQWIGELQQQRYSFYRLRSRSDIRVAELADAKAYLVGLSREDVRHQFLQAQGFGRLLLSANTEESVRLLKYGRVDLVVLSEIDVATLCQQRHEACQKLERVFRLEGLQVGLYAACSQGTSAERVQRLRTAYEALKREGKLKL